MNAPKKLTWTIALILLLLDICAGIIAPYFDVKILNTTLMGFIGDWGAVASAVLLLLGSLLKGL